MVAMSCSSQPLLLASLVWTGLCSHSDSHSPDPEFKAAFDKALAEQLNMPMDAFKLPVQHSAHMLHHPPPRFDWMPHQQQNMPPFMQHHPPQNQPPWMRHQPPHSGPPGFEEMMRSMHIPQEKQPPPGFEEMMRSMHIPQADKREEDLDHKLQQMLGGAEPPPGTEVVIELDGPGMPPMPGRPMGFTDAGRPMVFTDEPNPVEMMRALFPGPLQHGMHPMPGHAMPFAEPDPVVLDMLGTVDTVMNDVMTPGLHLMGSASQAPASCHADLQKHCPRARSQVHCLGLHSDDISEHCEKDVGKSVPFVCSHAIDQYCDVLQSGVLDCLKGHLQTLSPPCKDAVLATSKALAHLNGLKPQTLAGPEGAVPPAVQLHLDSWKNTNEMLNKEEDQIKDLINKFQDQHGPHAHHHHLFRYLLGTVVLVLIFVLFCGSDFAHAASSFLAPRGEPLLKEPSSVAKEFDQLV